MQILEGKSCVVRSTGCPTLTEYLKVRHCAGSGEGMTSGRSQFDEETRQEMIQEHALVAVETSRFSQLG